MNSFIPWIPPGSFAEWIPPIRADPTIEVRIVSPRGLIGTSGKSVNLFELAGGCLDEHRDDSFGPCP